MLFYIKHIDIEHLREEPDTKLQEGEEAPAEAQGLHELGVHLLASAKPEEPEDGSCFDIETLVQPNAALN